MQNQEIFKKPVWKAIFSMGIPSLISVLVMIIYNMADMYFIGFLNDYTQVAAVSLIMPVFSIMTAVSMLLGNGGCTLIAQALGAGEKKRARSYMSLCIWTAILLGVIIAGLIIVFSNPLLKFLGTNEEMWQYARNYMLILAVGSPAMLLNYAIACLVRGEGAIKPGLIANFVSTGMNILLDPVLILGVKMGVSGAALATVLSNVIGIVYLIWYKMHHEMILTFNPKPARESVRHLGRVFALGFPNAISNILNGFASTFSNQLLVLYGTSAVAAMAAAGKATMIVGLLQMGLCMGVQPLMAYYYGAGDMRRIKEVVMKLFILTLGIGVVFGAVGMLGSKALVGLFIQGFGSGCAGTEDCLHSVVVCSICRDILYRTEFYAGDRECFDGDNYISFEARSTTHTASLHYECDHEDDGYSNRTCDGRFYFDCSDIGAYGNYL